MLVYNLVQDLDNFYDVVYFVNNVFNVEDAVEDVDEELVDEELVEDVDEELVGDVDEELVEDFVDIEIDSKTDVYTCPCYAGKYPRIIELLSKFDINRYDREERRMYVYPYLTFCNNCKQRASFRDMEPIPLEGGGMYVSEALEITKLIKKNSDEFFTNVSIINTTPIKYLNILYEYANDTYSNVYVCMDEHYLARSIVYHLKEIADFANYEFINAPIKRDAFAYISSTYDEFALKLPMDIWRYIFDFI